MIRVISRASEHLRRSDCASHVPLDARWLRWVACVYSSHSFSSSSPLLSPLSPVGRPDRTVNRTQEKSQPFLNFPASRHPVHVHTVKYTCTVQSCVRSVIDISRLFCTVVCRSKWRRALSRRVAHWPTVIPIRRLLRLLYTYSNTVFCFDAAQNARLRPPSSRSLPIPRNDSITTLQPDLLNHSVAVAIK